MSKGTKGFTIVELLIVIVVIAILAALTIIAFNGIQNRAENSKTTSAVQAYVKALQILKSDSSTGTYPAINSCLGSLTTYANSNNGRCWGANNNATWVVNSSFISALTPYMSTMAEPSEKNVSTDSDQRRGAVYYYVSSTDVRIHVAYLGVSTCPGLSGLSLLTTSTRVAGVECVYQLP